MTAVGVLLALAGAAAPAAVPTPPAQDTACIVMRTEDLPLETRQSPLDSLTFQVGGYPVKVCYSRPSARGRRVFGGLVLLGNIWRTGANEPTMIHTTGPVAIAGVPVEPGSYSLYTVPDQGTWQIIVNRSVTQWGHESNYTADLRAQEVGRGVLTSDRTDDYHETMTFRVVSPNPDHAVLVLEWEQTQVGIPVTKN